MSIYRQRDHRKISKLNHRMKDRTCEAVYASHMQDLVRRKEKKMNAAFLMTGVNKEMPKAAPGCPFSGGLCPASSARENTPIPSDRIDAYLFFCLEF